MTDVKRYTPTVGACGVDTHRIDYLLREDGEFVRFEDYDALRAWVAEYESKDGQRTREHNILVRENREQAARLAAAEARATSWQREAEDNDWAMERLAAAEQRAAEAERDARRYRTARELGMLSVDEIPTIDAALEPRT